MGRDYTLLRLDPTAGISGIVAAAAQRGLPLAVLDVSSPEASVLYRHKLVLVRPGPACRLARRRGAGRPARPHRSRAGRHADVDSKIGMRAGAYSQTAADCFAVRQLAAAKRRVGSIATLPVPGRRGSYTPNNGHSIASREAPLRANCRLPDCKMSFPCRGTQPKDALRVGHLAEITETESGIFVLFA